MNKIDLPSPFVWNSKDLAGGHKFLCGCDPDGPKKRPPVVPNMPCYGNLKKKIKIINEISYNYK